MLGLGSLMWFKCGLSPPNLLCSLISQCKGAEHFWGLQEMELSWQWLDNGCLHEKLMLGLTEWIRLCMDVCVSYKRQSGLSLFSCTSFTTWLILHGQTSRCCDLVSESSPDINIIWVDQINSLTSAGIRPRYFIIATEINE